MPERLDDVFNVDIIERPELEPQQPVDVQKFTKIKLTTARSALRAYILMPENPVTETAFTIHHGYSSTGPHYQEMMEALAGGGYPTIGHSPDRSFAKEDILWNEHPVKHHVDDANEVIAAAQREIGVETIHGFGHSNGGLTAANLVAYHEMMKSATLSGSAGFFMDLDFKEALDEFVMAGKHMLKDGPEGVAIDSIRHFRNIPRLVREGVTLLKNPNSTPYIEKGLARGAQIAVLMYGDDKIFKQQRMVRSVKKLAALHPEVRYAVAKGRFHVNPNIDGKDEAELQIRMYKDLMQSRQEAA
ncbi:MAG: Serine aminopeptidase [Candidatus Saccharibacteria bacterium]|nr:Serine aminopeptidase [Candidatus Saccharibacteria bacterium]